MPAIKVIKRTVELGGNAIPGSFPDPIPAFFFNDETDAHMFMIFARQNGQPFPFDGNENVLASFLNDLGETVPIDNGFIQDGAACVTLSDACYHVPGSFTLTVSVSGAVVYECCGTIKRRSTTTAYVPSGEISVSALQDEIDDMKDATVAANTAAAAARIVADNIVFDRTLDLEWTNGSISSSGQPKTGTHPKELVNEGYIHADIGLSVVVPSGMKVYWYKYSDATYQSFVEYSGGAITESFTLPGGYYYRFDVMFAVDNPPDIQSSDGATVIITDYVYTDETLTVPGRPADSKATGDAINAKFGYMANLTASNDLNAVLWPGIYRWNATNRPSNSPTTNAARMMVFGAFNDTRIYDKCQLIITVDGVIMARGGKSAGSSDTVGYWGEWMYYRQPDATLSQTGYPADAKATGDAIAAVQAGVNGAVTKTSVTSYMDSGTAIGEVDGKTFRVPVTATGDVDLSNYFTKTENPREPLKLRVMQNNIGDFRFGKSAGEYEHTSMALAEKIANYRRFYGDYRPDILCLQEWAQYAGANNTGDTKAEIYDPLFRTFYYAGNMRAIGTNFICTTGSVEHITENSYTYQRAILEAYNIHVITFALRPNTPTTSRRQIRATQLEAILAAKDSAANYSDNVIICADLNAESQEELEDLITIGKSHNYHSFFSGDYWGYRDTYINPPGNTTSAYFRCIDGIWCKGNMKMVNAKVLFDETTNFPDNYVIDPSQKTSDAIKIMTADAIDDQTGKQYNDLASDHVPVIADIVVYG